MISNWNIPENTKIDLVDERDRIHGQTMFLRGIRKKLANIRFVKIFLENSDGLIWVPNVSKNMEEVFDISVARPVFAGDSYDDAFLKFVTDVLNVDISSLSWEEIGHFTPFDGSRTDVFIKAYKIRLGDEITEESATWFSQGKWYTPQQVFDQIFLQGKKSTNDFIFLLCTFYIDQLNKITVFDLVDFNPEKEIMEFISKYAETRHSKMHVEDVRNKAERDIDIKIQKNIKNNIKPFPAKLFPFLKKMSAKEFFKTRSDDEIVSDKGYLPFKYWSKKDRDNWYTLIANKFGFEFNKWVYTMSFSCTYWKKTDYKACGDCFEKLELEDGTIIKNNFSDKDKIQGISFKNKKKDGSYSVDEITTVYIHNTEMLPAKIFWNWKDIYSAKGHGTSGSHKRYITEIRCQENGHVESYRIK